MNREVHVRFCESLGVRFPRATHPYIPMRRGFLYLVAIVDWCSRKILSWRLSNTLDADFCVAALTGGSVAVPQAWDFQHRPRLSVHERGFTDVLKNAGVDISMDGRGRWRDNIVVERLWRSLKYEAVYLNAYETGSECRKGLGAWIELYNQRRPHSSLDDRTPDEAYWRLPRQGYCYAAA